MHTDAFFQAVHHGQDYARAGADFAIISDGCSSSPDTDCGARLLTLAASVETDIDQIVAQAAARAVGLLPLEALDATLLTLRRVAGRIEATVFGDGVVFGVRRDGGVEAWEIDQGGTPAYPAYRQQPQRWAGWAGEPRVRHWVGPHASRAVAEQSERAKRPASAAERRGNPPDSLPFSAAEATDHASGQVSDFPMFSTTFDPAEWRMVGVASDGLAAFRGPDGPVPLAQVLAHVTDIRVPRGRFIERSSTFFLRRTCPQLGWTPTDDYSVAAFWLDA